MRDIVRHIIECLEESREFVFCQVVETKGSTPQKAGAVMVVDPEGGQVGTLGGGCVENEVKLKGMQRLGEPGASLDSFVLDHDYAWADGLICGGKMVILTEAFEGPGALPYFKVYQTLLEAGGGFTEAIVLDPEPLDLGVPIGSRFLFDGEGKSIAYWPISSRPEILIRQVDSLSRRPKASVRQGISWLPTLPRIRLVIVGAGHVGQAVADLAAKTDFDVWVVDDRSHYANRERFPDAQRIVLGPIEEVLANLEVTPQTYALIVTRGHGHDQEALHHLAATPASYVGLIGSRRKIRLIFESLLEQGIPNTALARVAAPVGLEIGSQTVVEIAVSIVAELIAVRNLGRPPAHIGLATNSKASAS